MYNKSFFNQPQSIVLVKCLKRPSTESSPIQVLKKMHELSKKVTYFALDSPRAFLVCFKKSRLSHSEGVMTMKFPKEEEGFSPQDAHIAYKHLVNYHLHFLKLQSKCEFFYWKLMGVFFLSILASLIFFCL